MRRRTENFPDFLARLFPPEDGRRHRTVNATIQVTDGCNLACTYCYQINKGRHVMPAETGEKFIDLLLGDGLREYFGGDRTDGIVLEFIGGEPFLEIELVDRLTDYFIRRMVELDHPCLHRYRISICSNGVLYFDPRVQAYIKKHLHHLSFSISVDGNRELHDSCRVFPDGRGSYDIAMRGVKHFTEVLGGEMGSKMTLAPANISHTCEAVESLVESGYTEINLNCVYEEGWEPGHARVLYEQLLQLADWLLERDLAGKVYVSMFEEGFFRPKREDDLQNWCGGNGQMISVDWKGDIYPCIRYMESSLGTDAAPLIVGDVERGVLADERQRECLRCLQRVDRRTQSTDECFRCPIAEGCSWCTAYNYQVFGTPDRRATYICVMHKARALANAYYWNMQYRLRGERKRMKLWIPREWALEIVSPEEWEMLKLLESGRPL